MMDLGETAGLQPETSAVAATLGGVAEAAATAAVVATEGVADRSSISDFFYTFQQSGEWPLSLNR